MVGAATGTPGTLPTGWGSIGGATGLTSEIVAIGTDRGVSYIDFRFTGTTGNNFLTVVFLTGAIGYITNTSYSGSLYTKVVGGVAPAGFTPNVRIRYNLSPTGSTDIVQNFAMPSSGTPITECRQTATGTTTGTLTGTGLFFLQLNYNVGQVVDFTIRIGLPQLEQGAFAASVIPTSGSTVTRAADVASISGSNFSSWYRQDEGTVFAEVPQANFVAGRILQFSDGTTTNRQDLAFSNSKLLAFVNTGGSSQVNALTDNTITNSAKCSYGYKADDFAWVLNGESPKTDNTGTLPTVDRLTIGARIDSPGHLNGTIRRLTYWPQRLPNETLQTITQ